MKKTYKNLTESSFRKRSKIRTSIFFFRKKEAKKGDFSNSLEIANASGLGLGWLIFTLYFSFLFLAFFIWKIGHGKNWARITYLVLFILGVPFTIYNYLTTAVSILSIILGIAGMILQIVSLVFLFEKKSSDWFKSMKK